MKYAPTNLILFGVTGDLAAKKTIPALYHLYNKKALPELFNIVGFSRREWSDENLREHVVEVMAKHADAKPTKEELESFLGLFRYVRGNFENLDDFKRLGEVLGKTDKQWNECSNKLFYLSVPPKYYKGICANVAESGLAEPCSDEEGWTRVLIEKPFGIDSKTAQELEEMLSKLFKEEQIYRIDHYLGKEMMQNVLLFRFANNLLERNWSNELVESIEIEVSEDFGVENRVTFYDGVGALRDVGQNHLLQMLAILTMDNPGELDDEHIRENRAKLLSRLKVMSGKQIEEDTKRGQYEGYTKHENVDPNSKTETYFKLTAYLEGSRWEGVPITLESGKKLPKNDKKIVVDFKSDTVHKNRVIFDLDGEDAGIFIEFWVKMPGLSRELEKKVLSFSLCESAKSCNAAEEYEKLLIDCIKGNQVLFVSSDEIKAMWKFVDPIVCAWEEDAVPLEIYEPGSKP